MNTTAIDPVTGDPIHIPRPFPLWLTVDQAARRAWCWMFGGHVYVRRYGDDRLYLACADCGRETRGWATPPRRPPVAAVVRRLTRGSRI